MNPLALVLVFLLGGYSAAGAQVQPFDPSRPGNWNPSPYNPSPYSPYNQPPPVYQPPPAPGRMPAWNDPPNSPFPAPQRQCYMVQDVFGTSRLVCP